MIRLLLVLKLMNIDWDEELAEFFNAQYFKEWKKINEGQYEFITLEGNNIRIQCS